MGIFRGVENARVTEGGNYLEKGDYDLEIIKVVQDQTRKKVDFIAVTFKVIGSDNPKYKIGDIVDWFNGADKDAFLSNAKEFGKAGLQAISDAEIAEADITEAVMEELFPDQRQKDAPKSPLIGYRVRCRVVPKPIKSKPGEFFSRHYWYPIRAELPPEGVEPATT